MKLVYVSLLLCFYATLAGCSAIEAGSPPDAFSIHIGDPPAALFQMTYEESWLYLQGWYPAGATYSICLDDITAYAWDEQKVTLTTRGSREFHEKFGGMAPLLTFVVTASDVPQYGGLITPRGAAFVADFPVIYEEPVMYDNPSVIIATFIIRPRHPSDDVTANIEDWRGITSPAIKSILADAGKIE